MTGKAEQVLPLVTSHISHIIDHHHQPALDTESEMYRRLWWFIHMLNRRIAIRTGRSFFLTQEGHLQRLVPRDIGGDRH
jgi:hypothetical protein